MSIALMLESNDQSSLPFDRQLRAKQASNHAEKRLLVLQNTSVEENRFVEVLQTHGQNLKKRSLEILQVNVGKICNLTCAHCHVEAGPNRTEVMSEAFADTLLGVAKSLGIHTVDLTGGAPEMAPVFRRLVSSFYEQGMKIMVRSNLTILLEPGYDDYIEFFKAHQVHVVASLPCYSQENVDKQRGDGVFMASIKALKGLNAVGYGSAGTGLLLDLVYNPGGASLPGPQDKLEQAYKAKLWEDFRIEFNSLYCITNLPIGRFYSDLKKEGKAEQYDRLLRDNFNVQTVPQLMCTNTLNVSWDGWVYDCDFNQMLELPTRLGGEPVHICNEVALGKLLNNRIATGNHCFGCTAGAGSSCTGELLQRP